MAELTSPKLPIPDRDAVRDEWVRDVEALVRDVEGWCRTNDWPTRRIEKRMKDSVLGDYHVPALLIQADLARILLEPIARHVPDSEGVIDLYLMPGYDDIASIYRTPSGWTLHYMFSGAPPVGSMRDAPAEPFGPEVFTKVVAQMARNARA
jgi:hypothetical protein